MQDPESDREIPFVSRFTEETRITLSDDGVTFTGSGVSLSSDIIYYEQKTVLTAATLMERAIQKISIQSKKPRPIQ